MHKTTSTQPATSTPEPSRRVLAVLPTLGERPDLLEQTLQSLTDQGAYAPDIIIICPRSSDGARKQAKKFGAQVADDPGSLSAAINVGLALAKPHHDYVVWIGDDDLLRPNAVATGVAALDSHPKAVIAYGYCDYIDDTGRQLFKSRAGRLAPWLMTWGPNLLPEPTILFRRSALEKVGGFDESLKYSMDLDILLKLRKQGAFINIGTTLAAFRWHPSSTTVANRTASLKEAQMVQRRYLPKPLAAMAPLWEWAVRRATHMAARRVNTMGSH